MGILHASFDAHRDGSDAVFAAFGAITPLVEALSVTEAFLDVSGVAQTADDLNAIAAHLQARVADELGVTLSIGGARTKFLAKVAGGVARPDGVVVVDADAELEFLHPLDVSHLWGVGPATVTKLRDAGLDTVGQVADVGEEALVALVGAGTGRHLSALAHNHDHDRQRPSVGAQRAIGRRRHSRAELDAVLVALVDGVTERVRHGRRVGRTLALRTRFDDDTSQTWSRPLADATDRTDEFLVVARALLAESWPTLAVEGCTLLGVTVADLVPADAVQLRLSLDGDDA